jgi:hypothetical protein
MIGCSLVVGSVFGGLAIWFGEIRPYLSHHGATVITGASWGVSAWADWQQCSEFARTRKDLKARRLSGFFTVTQIGFAGGVILAIFGI